MVATVWFRPLYYRKSKPCGIRDKIEELYQQQHQQSFSNVRSVAACMLSTGAA